MISPLCWKFILPCATSDPLWSVAVSDGGSDAISDMVEHQSEATRFFLACMAETSLGIVRPDTR